MSGRLKWYAARLATMSPAEIAHRFIELARKKKLARLSGGWAAFAPAQKPQLPDFAKLRSRLAGAAMNRVDEVLKGARFLGRSPAPPLAADTAPPDDFWFRDPVSGRRWPGGGVSALSVDVRSTSATPSPARPFGDVKFVWEPNRLQILHPLAAIAAAGGGEAGRAQKACFETLRSWMAANPPYRGVNWTSGIELSLRLLSVTLAIAARQDGNDEIADAVFRFVEAHAHMLEALPSLYSSANNHRVAEGLGLFLAGTLTPTHPRAARWRAHGREILESETLRQIFPDGVGGEQSPTYQAFTMELIAFGALLAADMGQPFSSLVLERLKAGARFLVDLQDENGNIPAIGDDDEGRALLAPHIDEPRYAASVAACVLGLCGEAREGRGLAPGYFRERLFGVAPHRPNFPAATLQTYREGGYTILRRRIVGRDIHLVFDHGPLGYLSLAAHGHADALAVWLSVDGRPVFIDAGTWLYHSGEDVRNELRSSQAHNTLSLAQMSQSEPSAAFSWAAKAQAHYSDEPADANASWRMAGEHDGYRARAGLAHRREIAGSPHGFAISDMLRGEGGAQAVELSFLCAPDILAYEEKGAIVLRRNGRAVLRMIAPEGFTASIAEGRYSPRFGELGCTAKILLAGRMAREPARTVFEFGTGSA